MKRLVAAILLLSLLINLIGFYPYFFMAQWQIKQQIKTQLKMQIPIQKLHAIYFGKNQQVNWEKEGKEFKYNGKFYDVVYAQVNKTGVTYYCINDEEETVLFSQLNLLIKQKTESPNSPIQQSTKQLIKLLSLASIMPTNETYTPTQYKLLHVSIFLAKPLAHYSKPQTPPPVFI